MSLFKKATKEQAKLRLSIAGPSGSGKTYSALAIGTNLGQRIAYLDTEHGSASKYADLFSFDVINMDPPYHPDRFVEVIKAAAAEGYDVLIIDSLSHAWSGTGGLLEIVDQIAARMKTSNSFTAWKDATPIHQRLIEAIIAAPIHVIATMRSKQEYVIETNDKGRQAPRKIGMAPIQRDGVEYEFDVFTEMDMENRMLVQKSRCVELSGKVFSKPGADVAEILKNWLSSGVEVAPPPPPSSNGRHKVTPPATAGEATQALYEGLLSKEKAAALHKRLGAWGISNQTKYASDVIGREIKSFTDLTPSEATTVFEKAKAENE